MKFGKWVAVFFLFSFSGKVSIRSKYVPNLSTFAFGQSQIVISNLLEVDFLACVVRPPRHVSISQVKNGFLRCT